MVISIQKKMHQKDEEIRKQMDEYSMMKQKIGQMTKKDVGPFTARDFTDDIYRDNAIPPDMFVERYNSEMFTNLLVVANDERYQILMGQIQNVMDSYYEQLDAAEKKRVRDSARQKLNQIIQEHKKFEIAEQELRDRGESTGAAAPNQIEEESKANDKKNDPLARYRAGEERYQQLMENKRRIDPSQLDEQTRAQMETDDVLRLFLETESHLCKEGFEAIEERARNRMPGGFVPSLARTALEDREGNKVYLTIVNKSQGDDAVKALRKIGVSSKVFAYDRDGWEAEKHELEVLREQFENKQKTLNQVATDVFQETMSALMHLKVIRAFIEGVFRYGIDKNFMIGLVCPRKNAEKTILMEMADLLAENGMREYYGEKMDTAEQDDYWPFVAIPLTTPIHVFGEGS